MRAVGFVVAILALYGGYVSPPWKTFCELGTLAVPNPLFPIPLSTFFVFCFEEDAL